MAEGRGIVGAGVLVAATGKAVLALVEIKMVLLGWM